MVTFDADECLTNLKAVADALGESPTRDQYNENRPADAPSAATIVNRFGTWNDAKDAADLDRCTAWDGHDYPVNEQYFDTLDPESAYWLGFLHADGHLSHQYRLKLNVAVQDKDHLLAFTDAIDSGYVTRVDTRNESEQIATTLGGQHLIERVRELGITRQKSHNQTIPVDLLEREQLEYPFIRGYWDGDGSYSEHGRRSNWSLHAKCEPRLKVVLSWLREIGVEGGNIYGGNESSRIVITAEPDLDIMRHHLYPDGHETEPALDRKRDTFLS